MTTFPKLLAVLYTLYLNEKSQIEFWVLRVKIIPCNLHAPGHGGIVVEAGTVVGILPSRPEVASRCAMACFSGTDVGSDNDSIPLIGTQRLIRQIDLDPFWAAKASPVFLLRFLSGLTGGTALRLKSSLGFREEAKQRAILRLD